MLTYKETLIFFKDFIENVMASEPSRTIEVEIGKFGTMPSSLPAIWIYIKPTKNAKFSNFASMAHIQAFVCFDAQNSPSDASIDSLDVAEEVYVHVVNEFKSKILESKNNDIQQVFLDFKTEWQPQFDSQYDNIAVSFFEFDISYKSKINT